MPAATWTAPYFHDLQADLADAEDRTDSLLFDLLLKQPISGDLDAVKRDLQDVFGEAPDITAQRFQCAGGLQGLVVFDSNLTNQQLLILGVLDRLTLCDLKPADAATGLLDRVSRMVAPTGTITTLGPSDSGARDGQMASVAEQVLTGAAVLFFQGHGAALAVQLPQADKRSISEPKAAPVVMGPHEGFIVDADTNLTLVCRRLRTARLRVEQYRLGTLSRTNVYLLYVKGVCDDLMIAEVERRLARVEVDTILESNMLMELIRDAPKSPVPTMLRSERPDRVAAALAQGQFAIIVDGTPLALIAPITFASMLKSVEDYYQNWMISTVIRGVRLSAFLLGVFLPAFYVAIVSYHPGFIPPLLLATLAASRENVPLPALGEILIIMLLFEIIREASARIPSGIGSALTIGGTLVVGQAAVRAGLVSAPVIIITAAVIIAFFAIPAQDMVQFTRFLLYPELLAGGFLGIFGVLFVAFLLAYYLASLRSFGRPFLDPVAPIRPAGWKDSVERAPLWAMDTRPPATGFPNPMRQPPNRKPEPPDAGAA